MEQVQPQNISVLEPIGAAIEKTKEILFHPFDLVKWLTIGFCAWLATLGSRGGRVGGGGGNFKHGNVQDFQHEIQHLKEDILNNLPIILSVGMVVVIVVLVISLVLMWLKSRGQFMFLDCVAQNKAEVVNPWKRYAAQGNSLFVFNIILWLAGLFASAVFLVPLAFLVITFFYHGIEALAMVDLMGFFVLLFGLILVILTIALIKSLTTDFVAPIMYLRNCSVMTGWREFKAILFAYKWPFTLYLTFLFVVGIAMFMIVFLAIIFTCCCAACILAIPYIGTVLMLPLLVWRRAYSLCYLAQYGALYDVFPRSEVPVTANMMPAAQG
jgi:hypothetical protein